MPNKYAPIIETLRSASVRKGDDVRPMDEAQLQAVEAQLGYPLLADYREFLRDYAGVEVLGTNGSGMGFPLKDDYERGGIENFFGPEVADTYIQMRTNYLLEDGYRWYPGLRLIRDISVPIELMPWPEELLPIGNDAQGNLVCVALFGLRTGAIFFWSHTILDADNVYLVADSFDEFMHLLHS